MIKRVATFTTKPGTNPMQAVEDYARLVAAPVLAAPGAQPAKCALGRVVHPVSGTPCFWGIEETWWASEADAYQACDKGAGVSLPLRDDARRASQDEFWRGVADGCVSYMEEFVAKDVTADFPGRQFQKRISSYSLKAGADPDAFWHHHIHDHVNDGIAWGGDRLRKYTISRVIRHISGRLSYWGMVETWWDSWWDSERQADPASASDDDGDDFWERVERGFVCFVSEDILPRADRTA